MTKQNLIKTAVVALIVILSVGSICPAGEIKIEKTKMGKAYISTSTVTTDGGDLVIRGVLRRNDRVGYPIAAHVEAAVIGAGGEVIAEGRSADVKVAKRTIGRGYKSYERFEIRIPGAAGKATAVKLTSK
jgi:hypothetical protein